MSNRQNIYRFFQHNSKGFTLIEVLIAVAILGIIAVVFLGALATASRALFIADERATAASLARSQMEYVKGQAYITAADYVPGPPPTGGQVTYEKIADAKIPAGYTIMSVNRAGATVEYIIGVPWDGQTNEPTPTDAGLQRIKLIISHHDREVITLEGFKVDR